MRGGEAEETKEVEFWDLTLYVLFFPSGQIPGDRLQLATSPNLSKHNLLYNLSCCAFVPLHFFSPNIFSALVQLVFSANINQRVARCCCQHPEVSERSQIAVPSLWINMLYKSELRCNKQDFFVKKDPASHRRWVDPLSWEEPWGLEGSLWPARPAWARPARKLWEPSWWGSSRRTAPGTHTQPPAPRTPSTGESLWTSGPEPWRTRPETDGENTSFQCVYSLYSLCTVLKTKLVFAYSLISLILPEAPMRAEY